jgi:hypothetical protein
LVGLRDKTVRTEEIPVKSIVLATVAGLAAAASAQSVTLTFSASTTTVNVGDTVTWTVRASFTGFADPTAYYGGFAPSTNNGQLLASDDALGVAQNFQNLMSLFHNYSNGVSNGASVIEISLGQSILLGPVTYGAMDIFIFDVVTSAVGVLEYDVDGPHLVYPDDGIFTLGIFVPGSVVSDRVNIIPAPAGLVLVGLGGLAAARRRR